MRLGKTITISLPAQMGREIEKLAKAEHRTISELLREAFRRYKAQEELKAVGKLGKALARKKKLTPEDFGGPFEE